MKRVITPFASGRRVYPAGAMLPDDHPAVRSGPHLFEDVPEPAPAQPAETFEGAAETTPAQPEEKPEPPKTTGRKTATKKDDAGADGAT